MNYYVKELQTDAGVQMTAGIKARDDADDILEKNGVKPIKIVSNEGDRKKKSFFRRLVSHYLVAQTWNISLKELKRGDTLFIQFPSIEHSILLFSVLKKLKKRDVKIVLIIHDLELLRVAKRKISFTKKCRIILEEKTVLKVSEKIIVHNLSMKEYLESLGIEDEKFVILNIFDYLINDFNSKKQKPKSLKAPIIIAGTLRKHKAGYVYDLPKSVDFNLYGVGYENQKQKNISYKGAFQPDDLPYEMEGSFGLVWDGTTADKCSGVYGEYLKVNNPHKTSLYLASGFPVIIWKEAALAKFVAENKCGIVISSLNEIKSRIDNMSQEQYIELLNGASSVGEKMRNGWYMKTAIKKCLSNN